MAEKTIDRAIIMGAAPGQSWCFLRQYLKGEQWTVICADGGVRNAAAAGLAPEVIIGDWDSGGEPKIGATSLTLPAEKDLTDLQAAAEYALCRGATELLLCGCTGGRLDHTASNLVLLEWISARGGSAVIADEENEVRYLECGAVCLANDPAFRYLSIIPLDRTITGVYLRGVKYPLTNATLARGDTFSVSNEPIAPIFEVRIETGRVLIIRSERLLPDLK